MEPSMSYALGRLGPDPDHVKHFFALIQPTVSISQLPSSLSYQYDFGPIENQGNFGACVTFGTSGVDEFFRTKRGYPANISESALYSLTKYHYEPTEIHTQGLYVGDALKTLQVIGYVDSNVMPYADNDAACTKVVSPSLIKNDHPLSNFARVTIDANDFMIALYQHGPIVIGTEWVNDWFNPDANGFLSATADRSQTIGGHCVSIVGYSKAKAAFLIRNQWGTAWGIPEATNPGMGGYAWLPFQAVPNMVDDAYTVTLP